MKGILDYRFSFMEWLSEIKTPLIHTQCKSRLLNNEVLPGIFMQLSSKCCSDGSLRCRIFEPSKAKGCYKKQYFNWEPVKSEAEINDLVLKTKAIIDEKFTSSAISPPVSTA